MANPQQEILLKETDSHSAKSQSKKSHPASTFYKTYVKNWWLIEILSLLVGIAAIAALCGLLSRYHNKPAPKSNAFVSSNITLNTLVSILTTIGSAALLLSVSECISQLKWTWYLDDHRPLEDLDTFNDASRGALGGAVLLWRINIRQIASVGALLIIAGLAVDPLSQQLVHYKVRTVPGPIGSATLSTAVTWDDDSQDTNAFVGVSDTTPQPPLPMKGAIQTGLLAGLSVILDTSPACSSGNCTWPAYSSLAICASSADVTSSLQTKNVSVPSDYPGAPKGTTVEWYLTNQNYIINNAITLLNLNSVAKKNPIVDNLDNPISLDFSDSIAFKNVSLPVADVFIIYTSSVEDTLSNPANFSAVEFVLEWCVQDFTTNVTNGTASTQRFGSYTNFTTPNPQESSAFLTARPNGGGNPVYMIEAQTHYILQNYFRGLFQGEANLTTNDASSTLSVTNDATQALFQPFDIFGEKVNGVDLTAGRGGGLPSLQLILNNIATGMTNMIRSSYNSTSGAAADASSHPAILGTADYQETFVEIQWGWIAAPIVLLVGSVFFVLAVIISSSGFGSRQKPAIWTSSSLPLLKALSAELHQQGVSGMSKLSAMEEWAKDVPVRLARDVDGEGWKLVPHWSEKRRSGSQET